MVASGWSNPLSSVVNRRAFLRGGAGLIGGAVLSKTLGGLSVARVEAAQCAAVGSNVSPWGARSALENPDNIVVAPDGSIIFCEDNADGTGGVNPNEGERLVWLYPKTGQIFTFALNNMDFHSGGLGTLTRPSGQSFTANSKQNEWAGAVFSPDGKWMFVNNQTGVTFAVTGPWPWL